MSSTMPAVCGRHSETQVPRLAVPGELAARAEQLRHFLGEAVHEGEALALDELVGDRLAVQFDCSFGLWSNSSSWLGPPAMNR